MNKVLESSIRVERQHRREQQSPNISLQQLSQRVTDLYVPMAAGIVGLTFLVWMLFGPPAERLRFALLASLSVLIVACPCTLLLVIPVAIRAGIARGKQWGLLFKDAQSFERVSTIDTVVFDKTGTLTQGHPVVSEVVTTGDFTQHEVLSLAAAAESFSEHPLGAAIVRAAQKQNLLVPSARDFRSIAGHGIEATINETQGTLKVLVGNTRLMRERNIDVTLFERAASTLKIHGHTTVFVAINGMAAGAIALADKLKEDAAQTVEMLHRRGIEVVMLTGDNRATAEFIAQQAGIGRVIAEILPKHKRIAIQKLQAEGKIVAMVGDSINDAPVLEQADVAIALSSETSQENDITLQGEELRGVVRAFELSCATLKMVQQNLLSALKYNVFAIPIAAGLLYPFTGWLLSPIWAIVVMLLSCAGILFKTSRLSRFQSRV